MRTMATGMRRRATTSWRHFRFRRRSRVGAPGYSRRRGRWYGPRSSWCDGRGPRSLVRDLTSTNSTPTASRPVELHVHIQPYKYSKRYTMNKIVYKIFGAMSKDLHCEISAHLGIESVENLVANRRNRFINRHGETDNYLCQMLRWLVRFSKCTFYLFRLFNFCLLNFFHLCCATVYDGEIKLYI